MRQGHEFLAVTSEMMGKQRQGNYLRGSASTSQLILLCALLYYVFIYYWSADRRLPLAVTVFYVG